jgi:hypothetical protein
VQGFPSANRQFPPEQLDPTVQPFPQRPQFELLLDKDTHAPLHPIRPAPQHVSLEQFPLTHWLLLWQELPFAIWDVQAPAAQYWLDAHGTVLEEVQAPAPLQTDAVFTAVSPLQDAEVQVLSLPG